MANSVDVSVGRKIRLRRIYLGMSQEILAKAVGVSFQQIQKYERGINRVGSSRLFQIARFLSCPIEYFFDDAERDTSESLDQTPSANKILKDAYESMISRESQDMLRAYCAIDDPDVRKQIYGLIKSIAYK